jgi:hypothetical protein
MDTEETPRLHQSATFAQQTQQPMSFPSSQNVTPASNPFSFGVTEERAQGPTSVSLSDIGPSSNNPTEPQLWSTNNPLSFSPSRSLDYRELERIIAAQKIQLDMKDNKIIELKQEVQMLWRQIRQLHQRAEQDTGTSTSLSSPDSVQGKGKRPAPEYGNEQRSTISKSRQRTDDRLFVNSFPHNYPPSDNSTSTLSMSSASHTSPDHATSGFKHDIRMIGQGQIHSDDDEGTESFIEWDERN